MRKKSIVSAVAALSCAACMAFSPTGAFADDEISVYLDGEKLEFDVAPIIESARTLVPMRAIFEALGAQVEWDDSTKTASAVKNNIKIEIPVGSSTMYINDDMVYLDVGAMIVNERTLVPVRAISEGFGTNVDWDADSKTVVIKSPEYLASRAREAETNKENNTPLTDEDFEELRSQRELLRYDFEQNIMPEFVISNAEILSPLTQDAEEFTNVVTDMWNRLAAGYVMNVMESSETEYPSMTDFPDEGSAYDYHLSIAREVGLTPENYIEYTDCFEKDGVNVAMVIFKEADMYVQCKYVAIAAIDGQTARYFTAEHDVEDDQNWYFCEIAAEGSGVLVQFPKNNAAEDFKMFLTLAANEYNHISR